jgi:Flp pilus assembly protein TadD
VYGLFRRNPAAYAGAWCFLILAPTSSFLPLPTEIATERRMYLPLMGIVALGVMMGYRLVQSVRQRAKFPPRTVTYAGATLLAVLVVAEVQATLWRNEDYKDPLGMWADVVAHRPRNARAYNNLGREFFDRGDYASAKSCFAEAFRLNPRDHISAANLAVIALSEQHDDEALGYAEASLKIRPGYASAMHSAGVARYKRGEYAEAERLVWSVVRLQPRDVKERTLLGQILLARRDFAGAERASREVLELDPNNVFVHDQLGWAIAGRGDLAGAIAEFRKACQLAPGEPEYAAHLAWHLAAADDSSNRNSKEAVALAERAVAQSGKAPDATVLDALALSYAADGRFEDAKRTADLAIDAAKNKRPKRVAKIQARRDAYAAGKMPDANVRGFED